jgi:hypothetical protein
MSASSRRIPKYRHYRPKNLAVVRLNGRDHYLGRYDSPESHENYDRLIAEWLADGRTDRLQTCPSEEGNGQTTVNETIQRRTKTGIMVTKV